MSRLASTAPAHATGTPRVRTAPCRALPCPATWRLLAAVCICQLAAHATWQRCAYPARAGRVHRALLASLATHVAEVGSCYALGRGVLLRAAGVAPFGDVPWGGYRVR